MGTCALHECLPLIHLARAHCAHLLTPVLGRTGDGTITGEMFNRGTADCGRMECPPAAVGLGYKHCKDKAGGQAGRQVWVGRRAVAGAQQLGLAAPAYIHGST